MGDVVNLRGVRKAKIRSERERVAAANRSAHGRGKAEKLESALRREQAVRHLDGHRRDLPRDDD